MQSQTSLSSAEVYPVFREAKYTASLRVAKKAAH